MKRQVLTPVRGMAQSLTVQTQVNLPEARVEQHYRASFRQLDGASSPRIQQISLRSLPPGVYAISVTLTRADGSRDRAVTTIEVFDSPTAFDSDGKR